MSPTVWLAMLNALACVSSSAEQLRHNGPAAVGLGSRGERAGYQVSRCPVGWDARRVSGNVPLLRTARLRLEPVTVPLAQAILAGELSGVSAAPGWPHEHTAAGLAHTLQPGHPPGWLITVGGEVIGDCGTHGRPDERGGRSATAWPHPTGAADLAARLSPP